MATTFNNVSKARYEIIKKRYAAFKEDLDKVDSEPVKVFDPLTKSHLDELELIRSITKELQIKKEQDMKKAEAQAGKEQAENKSPAQKETNENVQKNS